MFNSKGLRLTTIAAAAALLAVAVGVVVLWGARPAEAAFPGANGKIVFSSNRATGDGVNNPTGDYEIFTMNPDGTGVTQLTENTGNDEQPAWSPDGQQIAFRTERDGNYEVYVMDAVDSDGDENGDNPTRLTTSTTSVGSDDVEPAWSPSGTKIAFRSSRVAGNSEVYVMDAKDEVDNQTGDPGPDGNGDNLTNLTNNAADDIEPAWSPSGTKIAFVSNRGIGGNPTGDQEIFTMNADGSNQIQRTKNTASDIEPAWSPGGKKLAFQSDQDGNSEIFTMNSDGTGRTNISNTAAAKDINDNDAEDIDPDWQPVP